MELKQRLELRKLLVPQLSQSLNILALPYLEMKHLVAKELESNPLLEEVTVDRLPPAKKLAERPFRSTNTSAKDDKDLDFRMAQITKPVTLQEILLRQLGMFTDTDEEFRIGEEIIGNIDENGYLVEGPEQIAAELQVTLSDVDRVLKIIQQFDPPGVAARSIPECMRIQLELAKENDPLLLKIIELHLEDVAKKNYTHISKSLKVSSEVVDSLIKKIHALDPKPGRNYSAEETQQILPDIILDYKADEIEIHINNEDIPDLRINDTYKDMYKNKELDQATKDFLSEKIRIATDLLRAISRRQTTLRRIVEVVATIQQDAIKEDLSCVRPLTFAQVAKEINMHESTVCRAVMNKYVRTPHGVVAMKHFFPSGIVHHNGEVVSSSRIKKRICELIEAEEKKHPLSDQDIVRALIQENIEVSRRTVAKYREELKILSSTFRRER